MTQTGKSFEFADAAKTYDLSAFWLYAYNDRGEVISGKRYFGTDTGQTGNPVAGQGWDYAFDNIGNRSTVTHNNEATSYTANQLNQYASRQVLDKLDVLGAASAKAVVTVNNQATTRQGAYYHKVLGVTNSSAAQWQAVSVVGVINPPGTNDPDIVTVETGHLFAAQSPEQFTYDDDGNLLSDGRWNYAWNGENRLIELETTTNAVAAGVPRVKLAFGYDYVGRRVYKTVCSAWTNAAYSVSNTTAFVYDGWNLISELTHAQTHTLTNYFAWGLDLSGTLQGAGGIGGLVASIRPRAGTVYEKRVAASADDAEEKSDGTVMLDGGDLDLMNDNDTNNFNVAVGLRFTGVAVPQGAIITKAYIQFTAEETQSESTTLAIWGELSDDAAAFTTSTSNISQRAATAASVNWDVPEWDMIEEAGEDQRTPDVSSIVQQIVNRPGWASGNHLALLVTGSGKRTAEPYDGNNGGTNAAPQLRIEYLEPNAYFPACDANGNVTQLLDADGNIAAAYEYDPFGNIVRATGPAAQDNPFRFSTKYYDDETGLSYYGFRYYNPELGRWLNRDPIGDWSFAQLTDTGFSEVYIAFPELWIKSTGREQANLYRFVENRPVNARDKRGLQTEDGDVDVDITFPVETCCLPECKISSLKLAVSEPILTINLSWQQKGGCRSMLAQFWTCTWEHELGRPSGNRRGWKYVTPGNSNGGGSASISYGSSVVPIAILGKLTGDSCEGGVWTPKTWKPDFGIICQGDGDGNLALENCHYSNSFTE